MTSRSASFRLARALALVPILLVLAVTKAEAVCAAVAERGPVLQWAQLMRPAALAPGEIEITYLGHSSFLIESPAGVSIVTDYNGFNRPRKLPTVVTMNNAHTTHFTDYVDGIAYVLRGWDQGLGPPRHAVRIDDVFVRNIPTNVRDFAGNTRYNGNSIFIFEVADLCVAHLGHLHHELTEDDLKALGEIDILLVPVDGSWTLGQEEMVANVRAIRPRLIVPMHFFSRGTLNRFLGLMRAHYPVRLNETPGLVVSRQTLPQPPEVIVLPGY